MTQRGFHLNPAPRLVGDNPHIPTDFAERVERERCTGCGRFVAKDSRYTNKCSDCWSPEDDFIF